jgi:hypothetical protein
LSKLKGMSLVSFPSLLNLNFDKLNNRTKK